MDPHYLQQPRTDESPNHGNHSRPIQRAFQHRCRERNTHVQDCKQAAAAAAAVKFNVAFEGQIVITYRVALAGSSAFFFCYRAREINPDMTAICKLIDLLRFGPIQPHLPDIYPVPPTRENIEGAGGESSGQWAWTAPHMVSSRCAPYWGAFPRLPDCHYVASSSPADYRAHHLQR